MKWDELLAMQANQPKKRAHSREEEHRIQCACVQWFRMEFPKYRKLLFAVPNGGARSAREGKSLKDEGVLAGVADLFLSVPNKQFHGLYVELKTAKGKQQANQKEFEEAVKGQGYEYIVCHSFSEFMGTIVGYLRNRQL